MKTEKMPTPGVSRRSFLLGSGAAAITTAVGSALIGCSTQQDSTADSSDETGAASENQNVYQVISEELNPQNYDYRSNTTDFSNVFSPWRLGSMEFSNRIVKSAAGSNYENGSWDAFIEYYRRLAEGGIEMIWVENFAHIFIPYTNRINANIDEFTDAQILELTDTIHSLGAKCGTQTDIMGSAFMTAIRERGGYDVQYLTVEEIDWLVESYRNAARVLKNWGFDAWELNCAGDNITQWFFSKARNHREDEYGAQSFENRTRFITRVIDAIQEECGEDWPIQILLDGIEENDKNIGQNTEFNTIEDSIEIAKLLEKAGAASMHVRLGPVGQHAGQFLGDLYFDTRGCIGSTSFGTQFDFSRHFQGALVANHDGCGLMLNISKMFKEALNIPVGTVTYLDPAHAPDFTDQAIADGMVDFLMMNRPLTVDTEYVNKLEEGRLDEIRPCTRCCHCWNDDTKEAPVSLESQYGGPSYSCRLDPVRDYVDQDRGLPGGFDPDPSEGDKNIMVVGAGPAGMEAARIAAQRGYSVTLYEKKNIVGGLLPFAAAIKGPHQNLDDYRNWCELSLDLAGVEVVTGQEVDTGFIKEKAPDAVILALGGVRETLGISGNESTTVVPVEDVVSGQVGQNVTVVGSSCQATDSVVYLLEQGKQVTIVTPDNSDMLCSGQSIWCRKFTVPMLYARGVRVWTEAEIASIGDGEITVRTNTGTEVSYPCDTIIEAMDMIPNKDMMNDLDGIEAYTVGDCEDPYNIQYAIRAGNFAARMI